MGSELKFPGLYEEYSRLQVFERIALIFEDVFSQLRNKDYQPGKDMLIARKMFLKGTSDGSKGIEEKFPVDQKYAGDELAVRLHNAYVSAYSYGSEFISKINANRYATANPRASGVSISPIAVGVGELILDYGRILGAKYYYGADEKNEVAALKVADRVKNRKTTLEFTLDDRKFLRSLRIRADS